MADESDRRACPVEFGGRTGEYFTIWIVNLVLSILTLGIYSAWAKVRTQRYFYGNTVVDGHAFDYHARPVAILFGRVIAVALLISYNGLATLSPFAALAGAIVLLAALPWLINRSMRFNARMSSYRNVRFNFKGNYWSALGVFILWPIAGIFTLGLLYPLADRAAKRYLGNRFSYGGRPFNLDIGIGRFYWIYFLGFLLFVFVSAIVGVIFAGSFAGVSELMSNVELGENGEVDPDQMAVLIAALLPIYAASFLILIIVPTFIATLVTNAVYNKLVLDDHRFSSTMSGLWMVWIVFSNTIAVILTLGLAYPWARIRQTKYRADHTALLAGSDLDKYTSDVSEDSAIGEEIAEAFDFEVGI